MDIEEINARIERLEDERQKLRIALDEVDDSSEIDERMYEIARELEALIRLSDAWYAEEERCEIRVWEASVL